jgi:hypothetical protein
MSTLEDLDDLERETRDKKQDQGDDGKKPGGDDDAEMKDAEKKDDEEELLDEEILHSSTADIVKRRRMLENEMRIMKSEFQRLTHEQSTMREKVKDNQEKIENNRYDYNDAPGGSSGQPHRAPRSFEDPQPDKLRSPSILTTIPLLIGNYHTSLETWSSSWTSTWRPKQQRKGPTSTWTLRVWANRPSSRPRPGKPSSFR